MILYQTQSEFFFEQLITLPVQIKKVPTLELINESYSSALLGNKSPINNKLCFELITPQTRFLIQCNSFFELKQWCDSISNVLSKIQFSMNNKNLLTHSNSILSLKRAVNVPVTVISPNNNNNNNNKATDSILKVRRTFSIRPHPPLIPHFQLPNDPVLVTTSDTTASQSSQATIKRFMYKKAKLLEPYGKYHGADDDLRLLNVIESFTKAKVRQSININAQEGGGGGGGASVAMVSNKDVKTQQEYERSSRKKLETLTKKQLKQYCVTTTMVSSTKINATDGMSYAGMVMSVEHESSI
jgi:hypothetical protein